MITVFMLLITVGAIALVTYPLVRPRRGDALPDFFREADQTLLQERKETIYADIKNLELDYRMGKLSHQDFTDMQARLKAQAAHILDLMEGSNELREMDDFIEAEVAAVKLGEPAGAEDAGEKLFCLQCGEQLSVGEHVCHRCGTYLTSSCPGCGREYRVGDRFCIHCGVKL